MGRKMIVDVELSVLPFVHMILLLMLRIYSLPQHESIEKYLVRDPILRAKLGNLRSQHRPIVFGHIVELISRVLFFMFNRIFTESRRSENLLRQSSRGGADERGTAVRLGPWKLRSTGPGKSTGLASCSFIPLISVTRSHR
jgi:hypothetical protein